MALEKVVISRGQVFDTLLEILSAADIEKKIMYLPPARKNEYVLRSYLPAAKASEALKQSGLKVIDLFRISNIDVPPLPPEDIEFISKAEQLSQEERYSLLSIIRSIQTPWWIPVLEEDVDTKERLLALCRNRVPVINRQRFCKKNPVFDSLGSLRDFVYLQTDQIPALSAELDVGYHFFLRVDDTVPVYSREPLVDKVFLEFKLLKARNQASLMSYLREIIAEK